MRSSAACRRPRSCSPPRSRCAKPTRPAGPTGASRLPRRPGSSLLQPLLSTRPPLLLPALTAWPAIARLTALGRPRPRGDRVINSRPHTRAPRLLAPTALSTPRLCQTHAAGDGEAGRFRQGHRECGDHRHRLRGDGPYHRHVLQAVRGRPHTRTRIIIGHAQHTHTSSSGHRCRQWEACPPCPTRPNPRAARAARVALPTSALAEARF